MFIFSLFAKFSLPIKTHGSESRGQVHARASSGLRDHYSELFTRMAALEF